MFAHLSVPYADVSAADLAWGLAPAGLPPLASVELVLGRARVRLTVLGASHEIVATVEGATCTEVIACGVAAGAPLPTSADRDLPGLTYRMSSSLLLLPADELALRARGLRARLGQDRHALVAAFPGHADAVTALAVRGDGDQVEWRTWHAYPMSGELVVTTTRLSAP